MRVAELNERHTAGSIRRMTMDKKGSEDMWWIIAGALLVLIVVVVLLTFFGRGTQKAEAGLSACQTTGGTCVEIGTCGKTKEGGTPYSLFECTEDGRPDPNKECCFGIKKQVAIA